MKTDGLLFIFSPKAKNSLMTIGSFIPNQRTMDLVTD